MILSSDDMSLLSNTVQINSVGLFTVEKTANVWTIKDGGLFRRTHFSGVWDDCVAFKLEDTSAK